VVIGKLNKVDRCLTYLVQYKRVWGGKVPEVASGEVER